MAFKMSNNPLENNALFTSQEQPKKEAAKGKKGRPKKMPGVL